MPAGAAACGRARRREGTFALDFPRCPVEDVDEQGDLRLSDCVTLGSSGDADVALRSLGMSLAGVLEAVLPGERTVRRLGPNMRRFTALSPHRCVVATAVASSAAANGVDVFSRFLSRG